MKILAVLATAVLAAGTSQEDLKKQDAVKKALQDIAQGKGAIETLSVTLDDLHPLWGGLRLKIQGDGKISQEAVRKKAGQPRDKVDPADMKRLVDLLLKHEAWEQREKPRPAVPDESSTALTIEVGETFVSVWEWTNDLARNKRLSEIRDLMQKIAWK